MSNDPLARLMADDPRSGLAFHFSIAHFRPLIEEIVSTVLARLDDARTTLDRKQVYTEREAAQFLGLELWALRDERKRGRIVASRIRGRRIRYLYSDLVAYLMRTRTDQKS